MKSKKGKRERQAEVFEEWAQGNLTMSEFFTKMEENKENNSAMTNRNGQKRQLMN